MLREALVLHHPHLPFPAGGNASRSELRPGDVLMRYNRRASRRLTDFQEAKGERVQASAWREGETFSVRLGGGPLGASLDERPLAQALAAWREEQQLLRGEGTAPRAALDAEVTVRQAPFDEPGYWLCFLEHQIARFGPDNNHPSYANPGRAQDLVQQWADLAGQGEPDGERVRALGEAIFAELQRQETPIHSMWNEIHRGFASWAKAVGRKPETI
jgi:hypothetical protein